MGRISSTILSVLSSLCGRRDAHPSLYERDCNEEFPMDLINESDVQRYLEASEQNRRVLPPLEQQAMINRAQSPVKKQQRSSLLIKANPKFRFSDSDLQYSCAETAVESQWKGLNANMMSALDPPKESSFTYTATENS